MSCAKVLKVLKEEFQCKNLCMNHEDPSLFVKAECCKPYIHVVLASFWLLFFISTLVFEVIVNIDHGAVYLTEISNLTFCVQFAFVIMDFVVTLHAHCSRRDILEGLANSTPWYMQLEWVLWNITATISMAITIFYFSLTKPPKFTLGSIELHIINSVHSLSVLLLSAKPMRILHFYQPMIYTAAYIIFSLIYNVAFDNEPIYGIDGPLDWKNQRTRTALTTTFGVFPVIPLFHVGLWCVYKFRVWVAEKCACQNSVSPRDSPKPRRNHPSYDDLGV